MGEGIYTSTKTENISGETKVRSSNFEILRIISMLLIIAYHYCIHGNNGTIFSSTFSTNQVFSIIFGSWGLIGVNCFVFISAYFLIDSGKFSSKKVLKIVLQTIFYSVCITAYLYISGNVDVSLKQFIKEILSPFSDTYWFITSYCMLYILFPLLNKIILSIQSNYLLKFIIILTLFIPIYSYFFSIPSTPLGNILFFIYLYLLMGYLKNSPKNWFEVHAKKGFIITSLCILFLFTTTLYIGNSFNLKFVQGHALSLIGRYSPVMVLDAIFLFYIFKDLKIRNLRLINTIANTTLGIYLFHENDILGRILWDKILKIQQLYYTHMYVVYLIVSVLALFIIGMVIDLIRINFIEKPLFKVKVMNKHLNRVDYELNTSSQ